MRKPLLLMLFLTVAAGCRPSAEEKLSVDAMAKMSWLYKADPATDLAAALRKKDHRFVGVYGVARHFPGLDDDCALNLKEVRMIDGTSDLLLGYEHAKLNAIANEYASHYNLALYLHLRDAGRDVCSA